jgi:hypothetical protein
MTPHHEALRTAPETHSGLILPIPSQVALESGMMSPADPI